MLSKRRRIRLFQQDMERRVLSGQWTTTGIEHGEGEDAGEALREAALKAAYGYDGIRVPEDDASGAVDDGREARQGAGAYCRFGHVRG